MENLKDWNINDVPGSVFCLFLMHFLFSNKSGYQITCRTPTAVEIRCLNSPGPVIILPFKTLKYHYLRLFGNKYAGNTRLFFPPETTAQKNNRFGGTFENSIGYVYQEKHVPTCWGKCVKKKLHGLYVSSYFAQNWKNGLRKCLTNYKLKNNWCWPAQPVVTSFRFPLIFVRCC